MRYLKTLLVSLLAFVGTAAFAQTWTGSEAAEGTFYLYNVGTGKWFCGGNNWGTHASVRDVCELDVVLAGGNGAYTIDTKLSNGGNSHFLNGEFCDGGAYRWTFTEAKTEDGSIAYLIGNGQQNLTASNANSLVTLTASTDAFAQWVLVSRAELDEKMAGPITGSVDATFFIQDPNFGRNNTRVSSWRMNASNQNLNGGANDNMCAESWRSSFTLSQALNVPNGRYQMKVQAALTDYANKYDGANYPVVYANDVTSVFNEMETADRGTSMTQLSNAFTAGKYEVGTLTVDVNNGSLTVGVRGTRTDTWCIWDNFRLYFQGNLPILKDLIAKANELLPTLNETNAADLQEAIDAAQQVADNEKATQDELEKAVADLQEAYNTADAENIAKKLACDVLTQVPAALYPADFDWTAERPYKYYKNNEGKYQLASRIAVAALIKLLEFAEADEKAQAAIKARLEELGIEDFEDKLADAITSYTRLVVETHGVGAALGEQGDPNYSRMYAAIEEAGIDNLDPFIGILLSGASNQVDIYSIDPGMFEGNVWTSEDGLLTITRENGKDISSDDYGWWYTEAGEDWTFTCNSEEFDLTGITPMSYDVYFTVNGQQYNSFFYSWFAQTVAVEGKTATLHIDEIDPSDPTIVFDVTLADKRDPWQLAGVERTISDIYEMLHDYADGYWGFDANFTAHIQDPNLTEGGSAWESTWNDILSNETLTDSEGNTEYPYFDANTWNESGTMEVDAHQTIQLPAGRYMLTAAGRASQSSLMKKSISRNGETLESYVWEGAFTEAGAEDPSNYFQLYAKTFEGVTTAKSFFELEGNKGGIFNNGWNDASVFFTMPSVGEVTIGVRAATNVKERWASATRFRLTRLGDATVYLDEDETLTDELNWDAVGNEIGAFAPTDFLLKKKMEAGKWYSFALPIDISTEQLVANFGEDVELAVPVETQVNGEQAIVNFLTYKPIQYYIEEDIFGNAIRGTQANLPYLIKPAKVKESNRYLFKNITTTETKSFFKDGYWSYGAFSLSLDEDNWWYTLGDEDDVKVYPNYRYQTTVPEAYTIEYSDTVKAYTSVIEAEGYDIAGVGLYIIDEEGYVNVDDSYLDILYQQLEDALALGEQKATWYPGIPAPITNAMTTLGPITNIWNAGAALKSMKAAIGEAQKAYEPSQKFHALIAEAEETMALEHFELVEGADADFKALLADIQKRFDAATTAAEVVALNKELEAAIAAYVEKIEYAASVDSGNYILQNVGSGKFFGAGNSWGTRSSLVKHGEAVALAKLEDGTYTLESRYNNGGEQYYLGANYFVDNGTPMPLTITPVTGGFFTIQATGDAGTGFLGFDGTSTEVVGNLTDKNSKNAQWIITSVEELTAGLAEAGVENPLDATFLMKDPNFSRNHRDADAWIWDTTNHNIAGANENFCAESWQAAFTLTQEVAVPNGVYRIDAQAALTDYTNAYDGTDYPVVFANGETSKFIDMEESDRATSMTQLSNSFSAGKYQVLPIVIKVTDGKISLGTRGTRTDTWCIWDNFELTYFGDVALEDVKTAVLGNVGGEATGINDLNAAEQNVVIYNLNGVRVKNMNQKGIYIVNGKKVAVK